MTLTTTPHLMICWKDSQDVCWCLWFVTTKGTKRNQSGERRNRSWPGRVLPRPPLVTQAHAPLPAPGRHGKCGGSAFPALESESRVYSGGWWYRHMLCSWLAVVTETPAPQKEADIYQNSHHLYKSVQASWFSAPDIQKSLVTGSISRAKFLEDDPRSSRQIGPPKDTDLGNKHSLFFHFQKLRN